jgi:hypothetical protein
VLRVRRARRARPSLYQLYVTVIAVAIYGVLVGRLIDSAVGPGLEARAYAEFWTAAVALALLSIVRSGTWTGPVGFSTADIAFLLAAPIALRDLVVPRLRRALVAGGVAGAIVGLVAALTSRAGIGGLGVGRTAGAVVGFGFLGVVAVAGSWLVQRSARAGRVVLRAAPLLLLACAGLLALGAWGGSTGRGIALWSGPWGWPVAALAGARLWWLGTVLVVALGLLGGLVGLRLAGDAAVERFLAQAQTRSWIAGSAMSLNYRSAFLARRAAVAEAAASAGGPVRRKRRWLPRPRRPELAIPWRDLLAMTRAPGRLGWTLLLAAGGTVEAVAHPGRILPSAIAALLLYFAGGSLLESLRVDIDVPERSRVLLGLDYGRVLAAHCLVPIVVLSTLVGGTVAVCAALGVNGTGVGLLGLLVTLVVPVSACAVLFAALGSRNGGRINESTLERIMQITASDPSGGASAVLFIAPWLLGNIVGVSLPILLAGHAALHATRSGGAAGAWVGFAALAAVIAAVLLTVVRTSKPAN